MVSFSPLLSSGGSIYRLSEKSSKLHTKAFVEMTQGLDRLLLRLSYGNLEDSTFSKLPPPQVYSFSDCRGEVLGHTWSIETASVEAEILESPVDYLAE